jgi:hypothetical protein
MEIKQKSGAGQRIFRVSAVARIDLIFDFDLLKNLATQATRH